MKQTQLSNNNPTELPSAVVADEDKKIVRLHIFPKSQFSSPIASLQN